MVLRSPVNPRSKESDGINLKLFIIFKWLDPTTSPAPAMDIREPRFLLTCLLLCCYQVHALPCIPIRSAGTGMPVDTVIGAGPGENAVPAGRPATGKREDTLMFAEPDLRADSIMEGDTAEAADTSGSSDTLYFIPGDDDYSLILAADGGDLDAVDLLVSRGADVNTKTWDGVTPLMYAAQSGFPEVADYLIGHGADVNATPDNGMTALISVSKTGNFAIAQMLLENGARADVKDYNGLSPLMYASAYNFPGIIALCLDHGADIGQRDMFGNDPLLMATCFGNYEAAKVLLDRGAMINSADHSGFTALHMACQNGDYDLVWMLVDRGAPLDAMNDGGYTPLAIAVDNGFRDIVELLLESGARINKKLPASRNRGYKPGGANVLDIAKEHSDEEMAAYLLENGAIANRSPRISDLVPGIGLVLNGNDLLAGTSFGIVEKKTGLAVSAGFYFRPLRMRVLDVEHDLYAIQYWERRYLLYAGLERNLRIATVGDVEFGLLPGINLVHSWGNYRGSEEHARALYSLSPRIGLYRKSGTVRLDFSYEYLDYRMFHISPHRLCMNCSFYFDLTRDKYRSKEIPDF